LAGFAVLLAVSAVAFTATATAQLAWQERDAISVDATEYRLDDGDNPTVAVSVTLSNPTGAAVTARPSAVVVYDGRVDEETELTVPRTARSLDGDRTIPAGGTATVTVVADVRQERVDRTATAIESGGALVSGTFRIEIGDRSDYVDI
jgi:hypothetical protein